MIRDIVFSLLGLEDGADSFSSESSLSSLSNLSSSSGSHYSELVGYICCGVAAVFFGSYMLPVKHIYSGNGIFYQWSMCVAIWCVGLCVNVYTHFPKFEPIAMIGGALWCLGNAMSVPIVNMVGLALGMSVWCVANCITGWASGTFGILFVAKNKIKRRTLNYVGAGIAVCSILLFTLVQSNVAGSSSKSKKNRDHGAINSDEAYELLTDSAVEASLRVAEDVTRDKEKVEESGFDTCVKKMPPAVRKAVGLVLALVSGFFYGTSFNPPQYLADMKSEEHSTKLLDYVFSHFTGILVTSTLLMMVYSACAKNRPVVYPRIILPGFCAGLLWAIAEVAWFIANDALRMSISFPIITSGPAIIATFWGIVLFREISGVKQIILVICAFCVTVAGVVIIALSNE